MSYEMTGAELFDSDKRFAVTMWEYSWMVQRTGFQSEYANWDKVLDEVVERGYDCIRIDAFPHLIARGKDGNHLEETWVENNFNHMWTNFEPAKINPRRDLVTFLKKVQKRGLYVGLSSWFRSDRTRRELLVQTPEDYTRIWLETLDLLAEEDLLELIVWVDLCNEFPLPVWCLGAASDIFQMKIDSFEAGTLIPALQLALGPWTPEICERVNPYITTPIARIRAKYPQLKYTMSLTSMDEEKLAHLDLTHYDLLEPHIWAVDTPEMQAKTGFMEALLGSYPYTTIEHIIAWIRQHEENAEQIHANLDRATSFWQALGDRLNLPLITTECWSTVLFEDLLHAGTFGEWAVIKEDGETGIRFAIAKGWKGIGTSNFTEPHFEGMWRDVTWHKKMTDWIRKG